MQVLKFLGGFFLFGLIVGAALTAFGVGLLILPMGFCAVAGIR